MKLSIVNFRPFTPTSSKGFKIKDGLLFRGGALYNLDDSQKQYFQETLAIQTVLDFRDELEAMKKPDPAFDPIQNIRIGALIVNQKQFQGFDWGELLSQPLTHDTITSMLDYLNVGYQQMPFNNPAYQALFDCLINNQTPLYFHCSAGKDRTGIAGVLIMLSLGFSVQEAIDDYLLSNQSLADNKKAFYNMVVIEDDLKPYCDHLLMVSKAQIQLSLDAILAKYENFDDFFKHEYKLDMKLRQRLFEQYCCTI